MRHKTNERGEHPCHRCNGTGRSTAAAETMSGPILFVGGECIRCGGTGIAADYKDCIHEGCDLPERLWLGLMNNHPPAFPCSSCGRKYGQLAPFYCTECHQYVCKVCWFGTGPKSARFVCKSCEPGIWTDIRERQEGASW